MAIAGLIHSKVKISELPSERAGKLSLRLPQAVFYGEASRIAIQLRPTRIATISVVVKFASSHWITAAHQDENRNLAEGMPTEGIKSPLKASLQVSRGREIGTSYDGEFSDATNIGLRIFNVNVFPEMGDVFLMLERLGKGEVGSEEGYAVELLIEGADRAAIQHASWETWD